MKGREVANALQDLWSGICGAATERLAQIARAGVLIVACEAEIGHFDVILIVQQKVLAFQISRETRGKKRKIKCWNDSYSLLQHQTSLM